MGAGSSTQKPQTEMQKTTQKPTTTDGITLENNPEAYEEAIQPFDKNTEYFDSEYKTMGKYIGSNTSYIHDDYKVTTHMFEQGSTSGIIYKLKTEKAAPTPEAATAVGGRKRRNKTNKRTNKKKRNTKKRR